MSLANVLRRLVGKVAVVTASTDGIGYAIARRLAQEGASVVISSRNQNNVDRATSELKKEDLDVEGLVCHVGNADDRKNLLDFALSKFGGIDVFINNAAVNPEMCPVLNTAEDKWDKIFDVNVKAAFLLTQAVVPHMETRGGGSVIYVSSVAAYHLIDTIGAYCVSKTALLGLTRAAALQCASKNIRVNCLCPGAIETKFSEVLRSFPGAQEFLDTQIPMKRLGMPNECAGAAAFLSSEDSSYMTGESIIVAGGWFTRL